MAASVEFIELISTKKVPSLWIMRVGEAGVTGNCRLTRSLFGLGSLSQLCYLILQSTGQFGIALGLSLVACSEILLVSLGSPVGYVCQRHQLVSRSNHFGGHVGFVLLADLFRHGNLWFCGLAGKCSTCRLDLATLVRCLGSQHFALLRSRRFGSLFQILQTSLRHGNVMLLSGVSWCSTE
jgi:hypothetical protein